MARMLGSQCRNLRSIGLDCPGVSRDKRQHKRAEERAWRRDWADDVDYSWYERNTPSLVGWLIL